MDKAHPAPSRTTGKRKKANWGAIALLVGAALLPAFNPRPQTPNPGTLKP